MPRRVLTDEQIIGLKVALARQSRLTRERDIDNALREWRKRQIRQGLNKCSNASPTALVG